MEWCYRSDLWNHFTKKIQFILVLFYVWTDKITHWSVAPSAPIPFIPRAEIHNSKEETNANKHISLQPHQEQYNNVGSTTTAMSDSFASTG